MDQVSQRSEGEAEAGRARAQRQRIARIALSVALVLLGLYVLQGFVRALAWAGVLAIATWPLYRRAARRMPEGTHAIVLPALFTLGTTLVFVVPLAFLAIQLGHEARGAGAWLAEVRTHGVPVPEALGRLPVGQAQAAAWWQANLADPDGARALLARVERADLMHAGQRLGTGLAHRAILFCFTLATLFFLYRDGPALAEQMLAASRRLFGPHGERVGRQMVASVHGTVDGLVLVGLGVGVVLGISYAVAGAPHPALLGAATVVGAMVPLGAGLVLGLASALVLAAGHAAAAGIVLAFGAVVIFVADHFIRPALIGGATRLPFLWVLLGILGGVETFGLLGLFVGPAVMAALILLWREWASGATTTPIA